MSLTNTLLSLFLCLLLGASSSHARAEFPHDDTDDAAGHSSSSSVSRMDDEDLLLSSYTFEQFIEDFDKPYGTTDGGYDDLLMDKSDQEEYLHRRDIFEANLQKILQHNRDPQHSYKLGVNTFTDRMETEVPMGYDKHLAAYMRNSPPFEEEDSSTTTATSRVRRHRSLANDDNDEDWVETIQKSTSYSSSSSSSSSFTLDAVQDLPKAVDWRAAGDVTTPIKSQGQCGSCWAFASTAVLESHVALATSTLFELSVQQLVSCVDNPQHCGGSGGCTGSTSELAFGHVQEHGIVDEWSFGYQSFHGKEIECAVEDQPRPSKPVASIDGWVMLPRNNYTVVMNVLAKVGPLAVAVACSPWIGYKSGVYRGNLSTQRETDVNHLVVLEGYGTDVKTGEDYWIVRNSWGPKFGESGRIRLYRSDPNNKNNDVDVSEDEFCGMDTTTADGAACTIDQKGHAIDPPPAKICGNSGILYDVSFPTGAHLV